MAAVGGPRLRADGGPFEAQQGAPLGRRDGHAGSRAEAVAWTGSRRGDVVQETCVKTQGTFLAVALLWVVWYW